VNNSLGNDWLVSPGRRFRCIINTNCASSVPAIPCLKIPSSLQACYLHSPFTTSARRYVGVAAALGGLSALRRRTCFLWATPLTSTGFITSSHNPTTLSAQHRSTAPHNPQHPQHKSPWLSSVSTRSSLTSVGTWTLSPLRRWASPFARTTVCECGVLEHGDGATTLRYNPGDIWLTLYSQ
jgi:hypothetical protein